MKLKLDERVKALEKRVLALEKPMDSKSKKRWSKLAGWAATDPLYDEAMRLAADWRQKS